MQEAFVAFATSGKAFEHEQTSWLGMTSVLRGKSRKLSFQEHQARRDTGMFPACLQILELAWLQKWVRTGLELDF